MDGDHGCVEPALTTARLRFDAWREDDLPLLYGLHSDSRVQAGYSAGPDAWTLPAIGRRLAGYVNEQAARGFTKWKMSLRDGTFVGRGGWSPWGPNELELGYAVLPDLQGKGYATEAAIGLVSWARSARREALVGFALVANETSRRILVRAGMTYQDDRVIAGALTAFYRFPT